MNSLRSILYVILIYSVRDMKCLTSLTLAQKHIVANMCFTALSTRSFESEFVLLISLSFLINLN